MHRKESLYCRQIELACLCAYNVKRPESLESKTLPYRPRGIFRHALWNYEFQNRRASALPSVWLSLQLSTSDLRGSLVLRPLSLSAAVGNRRRFISGAARPREKRMNPRERGRDGRRGMPPSLLPLPLPISPCWLSPLFHSPLALTPDSRVPLSLTRRIGK